MWSCVSDDKRSLSIVHVHCALSSRYVYSQCLTYSERHLLKVLFLQEVLSGLESRGHATAPMDSFGSGNDHRVPTPPPVPLHVATANKNHLNEEIVPLLPTEIGEGYSQII
jgi:hypothetical protein